MSIEKHLQELTAAVVALTLVMDGKAAGAAPAATPEKRPQKNIANATEAAGEPQAAAAPLTFPVLKDRFLALVKTDRPKAEGIIKALGVTKLTEVKLDSYGKLDDALKAAGV